MAFLPTPISGAGDYLGGAFTGGLDWIGDQGMGAAKWMQQPINSSKMMGAAQALLGASGWSKTPVTAGQALGGALQGWQQGEAQGMAMQKARDEAALDKQLKDLVMGKVGGTPAARALSGPTPLTPGGASVNPTVAAPVSAASSSGGIGSLLTDPNFQAMMFLKNPTAALQTFGSLAAKTRYEPETDLGKALYEKERLMALYGADDPRVKMYDQFIDRNVVNKPKYKERKRPLGNGLVQTEVSHDDGQSWQPLGPAHYGSNPYRETTMWDSEGNEYRVPTNVWQQQGGGSQGTPGGSWGTSQGAIDPVAGTRVGPQQSAGTGLGYRKTKPLTEKEYEGLEGSIKHVGNINKMRAGLEGISGFGTGHVTGALSEYVDPGDLPGMLSSIGIEVTPETQEFMTGYSGVAATVQSTIPGVPSNFDSKTYLRQLPKPGYSLETNRMRLDHAEKVSKEMLRAKLAHFGRSGRPVPEDLLALAAEQGVSPDEITLTYEQYEKRANQMVEQFERADSDNRAADLEAILDDPNASFADKENAMQELEKLWSD